MMSIRLAILTTHPIQYQVPWFRHLARQDWLEPHVFFGDEHGWKVSMDRGFDQSFAWDVPMLDGYSHEFLKNTARCPNVDAFFGVDNPSIAGKLGGGRFDAVLALGWHTLSLWQGFRAAKQVDLRLILRGESTLLHARPYWKTLARRILLRRVFKQAHAMLAIGTQNRGFYAAHGVAETKIYEAPYFVDNRHFGSAISRREEVRSRLGIGPGEFVFVFSGKLIPRKRPRDLVEAWSRLPPASRETSRLLIIGDGSLKAGLEARASSLQADAARIAFLGFRNQMELPELYAAADALVMPSDFGETWGLSANEAMAAGARVVLSDRVGAGADLVIGGVTGDIFPCGNVPFLRGVLQRYVQDRDWTRAPHQQAAVLEHIANFTMERATAALKEALA